MDAQQSFAASGLRWLELLRLPYFDPTRFIVVDSMHNLLLGLMRTHFVDVLGYELKEEPAALELSMEISNKDPNNPPPSDTKLATEVSSIINRLQRHIDPDDVEKFLANRHLEPLKYVARGVSCPGWDQKPTRAGISEKLMAWVRTLQRSNVKGLTFKCAILAHSQIGTKAYASSSRFGLHGQRTARAMARHARDCHTIVVNFNSSSNRCSRRNPEGRRMARFRIGISTYCFGKVMGKP